MLGLLQPRVILDLELQKFGYEGSVDAADRAADRGRRSGRAVWRETDKLVKEFARFSAKDAAAYPRFVAHLAAVGPVFRQLMWEIPFDPAHLQPRQSAGHGGVRLAQPRHGRPLHDVADLLTMSAYDYLSRWFESDAVMAIMGYYPVGGSGQSVSFRTPGTAYFLLRGQLRENIPAAGGTGLVRGGMGQVAEAIRRNPASGSAWRRASTPRFPAFWWRTATAVGAALANGDEVRGGLVISNASARHTFLNLVDENELPSDFLTGLRGFGGQATPSRCTLAVEELPRLDGIEASGFGDGQPSQITIAPSVAWLEQAYRRPAGPHAFAQPVSDRADPVDRRPDARARRQAPDLDLWRAHPVRTRRRPRRGDASGCDRAGYCDDPAVRAVLSGSYAHRHVLLAKDYEEHFGLPGGNPHHADLTTLSQLFFRRPASGFADYTTPVRDLFLW